MLSVDSKQCLFKSWDLYKFNTNVGVKNPNVVLNTSFQALGGNLKGGFTIKNDPVITLGGHLRLHSSYGEWINKTAKDTLEINAGISVDDLKASKNTQSLKEIAQGVMLGSKMKYTILTNQGYAKASALVFYKPWQYIAGFNYSGFVNSKSVKLSSVFTMEGNFLNDTLTMNGSKIGASAPFCKNADATLGAFIADNRTVNFAAVNCYSETKNDLASVRFQNAADFTDLSLTVQKQQLFGVEGLSARTQVELPLREKFTDIGDTFCPKVNAAVMYQVKQLPISLEVVSSDIGRQPKVGIVFNFCN